MSRRARQGLAARIAVTALLFAQGILAFADCEMPVRTPAAAIASSNPPCHDTGGEANLCLMHCLAADQSLDKPDVTVHPLLALPVLAVRGAADFNYASFAPRRLSVPQAAAPPRILFRPLRI
jgi:hypothetical protein